MTCKCIKFESRNPNLKTNVKNMMDKLSKFMRILTSFSNAMNKFCNPSLAKVSLRQTSTIHEGEEEIFFEFKTKACLTWKLQKETCRNFTIRKIYHDVNSLTIVGHS